MAMNHVKFFGGGDGGADLAVAHHLAHQIAPPD